jgi:hypothetical protein
VFYFLVLPVAFYAGMNLIVPAVLAGAIGLLLWRMGVRDMPRLWAAAVAGGHALWMLTALFVIDMSGAAIAGVAGLAVLVLLFVLWPHSASAVLLLIDEAVMLTLNVLDLATVPFMSPESRALLLHGALRVAAIVPLLFLLLRRRRRPNQDIGGGPE